MDESLSVQMVREKIGILWKKQCQICRKCRKFVVKKWWEMDIWSWISPINPVSRWSNLASMVFFAEMEIRKTKKEVKARIEKMRDKISQMFLLGSLSGIAVLGDVIREYLLVNLIVLFVFVNMGIILIRMYLRKSM